MNKQVHTTEQVPEQIPGQITAEEVLNTGAETGAAAPCQNSQEQPSQVLDDQTPTQGAEREIGAKNGRKTGTDETGAGTGADLIESGAKQVRTGRKPGTKDVTPRKKRTDFNLAEQVPADEKQQIVRYNVELFNLGRLNDPNDEEEVRERLATYFSIAEKYQQVPTVASLALALGIDRRTLWTWMEEKVGTIKNRAVLDTLKRVYNLIASQYEGLLTQGKIIPVAGFFLMQNNFGYKNQTDHVVVAQPAEEPNTEDIAARAGLLDGE